LLSSAKYVTSPSHNYMAVASQGIKVAINFAARMAAAKGFVERK